MSDQSSILNDLLDKLPKQLDIIHTHPREHQLKVVGYNDAIREVVSIIKEEMTVYACRQCKSNSHIPLTCPNPPINLREMEL